MHVIGHDPRSYAPGVLPMLSNAYVCELADVISLHVHLDDSTRGLVDREFLSSMKPGAFLINTSRGGIVDEHAIVSALEDGYLGGYAADVVESELTDDPAGGVIADAARRGLNVIVTPHVGGMTHDARRIAYNHVIDLFVSRLAAI